MLTSDSSPAGTAAPSMPCPWNKLRQRFEAAREERDEYDLETYGPALNELARVVGEIPPQTCDLVSKDGGVFTYSYLEADRFAGNPWFEPLRELARAHEAFGKRHQHYSKIPAWRDIVAHMRGLDARLADARDRLMREPAPDARALAYKLGVFLDEQELRGADHEAMAADAARLA